MSTMTLDTMFQPTAFRAPARRSQVRLTRRGRVVVLLAALVLAFVVGVLVAAASVATQEPGTAEPTKILTVGSGDTLWDIAADITPAGGDVRETMADIEALNALDSSALQAGQRLVVPAR
jgi:LysM repeat protein